MLDQAHPRSGATVMLLITDLLCAGLCCTAVTEKFSSQIKM